MIARYTRPQMGAIWTDQGRLERWLELELPLPREKKKPWFHQKRL